MSPVELIPLIAYQYRSFAINYHGNVCYLIPHRASNSEESGAKVRALRMPRVMISLTHLMIDYNVRLITGNCVAIDRYHLWQIDIAAPGSRELFH